MKSSNKLEEYIKALRKYETCENHKRYRKKKLYKRMKNIEIALVNRA